MSVSTTDRRHLAPVPDADSDLLDSVQAARQRADSLTRGLAAYLTRPPAPPALSRAAQLDLDQAELFLLSLDGELGAEGPRTAYLLGLAEGHLANLIELVRGLTGPVTEV